MIYQLDLTRSRRRCATCPDTLRTPGERYVGRCEACLIAARMPATDLDLHPEGDTLRRDPVNDALDDREEKSVVPEHLSPAEGPSPSPPGSGVSVLGERILMEYRRVAARAEARRLLAEEDR